MDIQHTSPPAIGGESPEQTQEVLCISDRHGSSFACNMKDLPGASELEHRIDTGKRSAITLNLRRNAERKRIDIDAQVQEMRVSSIILSSLSSWAATVGLVKKKTAPCAN